MKIAFYAPLKSPNDPTPSGDRQIARNMMAALSRIGHDITLASDLRTFEGRGDSERQTQLQTQAHAEASKLLASYEEVPETTPDLWMTYHIYHKAPDWIGPIVSEVLAIPYVAIEASISPKAQYGKWRTGHAAAINAVGAADLILGLNPRDAECVRPTMKPSARYFNIAPFIETQAFETSRRKRQALRSELLQSLNLEQDQVIIVTVGMMREGDKYESYRVLAKSLDNIVDLPWHLLCVGDGPARAQVELLFAKHTARITWCGQRALSDIADIYAASDVLAWPAINEALGMVFLEASAAGCPVVAGYTDGVASIVLDGKTGCVSPAGDSQAFAEIIRNLITDHERRKLLGDQAHAHVRRHHSIQAASEMLQSCLSPFEHACIP